MSQSTDRPTGADSPAPDRTPKPNRILAEPATLAACRADYETPSARLTRIAGAAIDRSRGTR